MNDFERLFTKIAKMQGTEWDFQCSCKDCYWNMWSTNRSDSFGCVSESLGDTKMNPNTKECPSYWSYQVACGCDK